MPKELTHWITADCSLAGLKPAGRLARVTDCHRELYLAGAVLPDTLMHLFRGTFATQAVSLAQGFHDAGGNSYQPLIQAEKQFPEGLPDPLLACLLGVLSHIQTDIVFHPFVFALSGTADAGRHYRLETEIDKCFLLRGTLPPERRLANLVNPHTARHLLDACILLFDPDHTLPPSAVERALRLHCRFQAMYGRPIWQITAALLGRLPVPMFRRKQHLFYPLSGSVSETKMAGENRWRHPVNGLWQDSALDDLAQTAIARTVTLFSRIEAAGELTAPLVESRGENLLTGLYGVRQANMTV